MCTGVQGKFTDGIVCVHVHVHLTIAFYMQLPALLPYVVVGECFLICTMADILMGPVNPN